MFGGIVETTGTILYLQHENNCLKFDISPQQIFDDLKLGDSVAVNGICLTITHLANQCFSVTAVPETLNRTNLHTLVVGSKVNLERSLQVGSRIGGHNMQGHVDFCGEIIEIQPDGEASIVKFSYPASFSKYLVNKGYVGIDGMSITLIDVTPDWFSVTLIPHTQDVTIANQYSIGTKVNIEVDIVGKYIAKLLGEYTECKIMNKM